MAGGATIQGLASLDAALASVRAALTGPQAAAALLDAVQPTLQQAQARAPRHTGELVAHLQAVATGTRHGATARVEVADSAPGGAVRQAIFAEFGTSREAAHPYLRPAFEATKETIVARYAARTAPLLKD